MRTLTEETVANKTEALMADEVARSRGSRPRWRTLIGVALAIILLLELGGRFVVSQSTFEDDLLPRILEEHRAKINERTAEGIPTDLMFFGTSSTGAAFDPAMVPGGTAYDMWWAGADAAILNRFAADFAEKLVDPQTVVIGITSRELNDSRVAALESTFDQASSTLAWRRVANTTLLTDIEIGTSSVSDLVKYRTHLRKPTSWISWITGTGSSEVGLSTGDFGELTNYRDSELAMTETELAREREALANYSVGGAEIDALGELLTAFGDKRVVLVFLPVSESTYAPLHPNGIADVEAARLAAQAAADGAGVEFLDLSKFGGNDDLFGDGNHLNQRGSAIVTTEVLTFLSR